jgi:DNA adenine methylase
VLFAKTPAAAHEILNDVDGEVVNFLRQLRDRPADLELACRLTPYARDEYAAAMRPEAGIDDLERARRFWVQSSQGFGQVAKSGTGWSTSVQRGSNNARSAWNRLERFAPAAARLGGVCIENLDWTEAIDRYATPEAVIYADPPYLGSTRSSLADRNRARDYTHEFQGDDDHRRLAEALRATPATVLLSGYPSDLYDDLYDGWWTTRRRVLPRMSNGRRAAGETVVEVIWSNRPLQPSLFDEAGELTPC